MQPEDSRFAATWAVIEQHIRKRLEADRAHPLLITSFLRHARHVHSGATGLLPGDTITPVEKLPDWDDLNEHDRARGQDLLKKTLMIKLNGGLGTSMGLDRAKSLLPVKNGMSFLDIIARQVLRLRSVHKVDLPLLFMTSYSTDADTLQALSNYPSLSAGQPGIPLTFLQNRVPKLRADTLLPAEFPEDADKAWCPPGHGDLYAALVTSGLLDQLVARGFRYAFVSNSDNLGAVIDPAIPGFMANREIPFLIEATDRTEADRKGGHLAFDRRTGRLILRESAQCPPEEQSDFQDIAKYRYFNTNNLWIDIAALHTTIKSTGAVPDLAPMVNRKPLNPRDDSSAAVLQLETAMGAAVTSFEKASALRVPRARFAPVKTTDDLLGLWSDAYEITEDMHIRLSSERTIPGPPVIKLDPRYYRRIDDFTLRFPEGAPSLLRCRKLTVSGDHVFHAPLAITGEATYENNTGNCLHVR